MDFWVVIVGEYDLSRGNGITLDLIISEQSYKKSTRPSNNQIAGQLRPLQIDGLDRGILGG